MSRLERAFTLIELMIVVAIVGTLAALAIPAYQDYTIRAQVAEGLSLAAGAQAAVEEFYSESGAWPTDNAAAGLAGQDDITGKYTDRVSVSDNVIDIRYGLDAHQNITGDIVSLAAVDNDGSISWTCTSADINDNRLPRACRTGAAPKGSKKK